METTIIGNLKVTNRGRTSGVTRIFVHHWHNIRNYDNVRTDNRPYIGEIDPEFHHVIAVWKVTPKVKPPTNLKYH